MTHDDHYPWIDRLESVIYEMDEIPLLLSRTLFDLRAFSDILAKKLETPGLEIKAGDTKWVLEEEIQSGIGENADFLPFTVSPIKGHVFWIMDEEDIAKLTTWLLTKNEKQKGFSSQILQEGFYHYLLLETIDSLLHTQLFENLSPKMNIHPKLPAKALSIDIEIKYKRSSCWGRLLLSEEFRKSWKEYFQRLIPHPFHMEIARNYELTVGLRVGDVSLDQKQLKKLSVGDFVLLDHISYDMKAGAGSGVLTLNGTPLIQMSIKDGKSQVIGDTVYEEENTGMDRPTQDDDFDELPPNDGFSEELPPDENPFEEREQEQVEDHHESSYDEEPEDEPAVTFKDIPLSLHVEVARLKMSLDALMRLEPGNLIELPTEPGHSVTLTVSGKKIGRAELVYLGETLGIRILELGK